MSEQSTSRRSVGESTNFMLKGSTLLAGLIGLGASCFGGWLSVQQSIWNHSTRLDMYEAQLAEIDAREARISRLEAQAQVHSSRDADTSRRLDRIEASLDEIQRLLRVMAARVPASGD